ncbi:MAG: hypothetical protein HY654_05270 [Acidobacteria bacterium]|nr:hypothetical protein [Acidobacteriota bacterium]
MAFRGLPAFSLVLALPAYLLTHESFRPIEHRFELGGREAVASFDMPAPEPLFLEFELVVRTLDTERPAVALHLNAVGVARIQPEKLYVQERARLLLPHSALRAGRNQLAVTFERPTTAVFEMRARLHNYYGISPRFPRAVVVADEAATHFVGQLSPARRTVRFSTFLLLSAVVVGTVRRLCRCRSHVASYGMMLAPSVGLWCALAYGLATPLEIWLSWQAVVLLALVPWLLTAGGVWAYAHRVVVLRLAVASTLTAVLVEAAFRLVNHFRPSFVFYSDAYDRYRGQPGARHFDSSLNSRGFNDVEHSLSKPPGVAHRIAAIGDSFAFGVVPYRANYLTLLEAELVGEGPVEVINMGLSAAEPRDYLAILVKEGLKFDPDLVMVGFFMGNDFEETEKRAYESFYIATFFRFLWQLWKAGPSVAIGLGSPVSAYDDDQASLPLDRFLEIAVDRAGIYGAGEVALKEPTSRAAAYLREMRDISRRAGADLFVVLIPDQVQIDRALQDQVAQALGVVTGRLDFRLPNRLLADELTRHGIRYLDLLPVFEQEGRRTRLYKPHDTHWNIAGNKLAASQIAAFVREHVLQDQADVSR